MVGGARAVLVAAGTDYIAGAWQTGELRIRAFCETRLRMADVFLSYASANRQRAQSIASALEARGWSLWWDRNIGTGKTFDEAIERELDRAGSIVVLWSKESVSSEWVRNEASVAARRNVLLPVSIDEVKLPLEFMRRQTIDLIGWDGVAPHPGFEALCEAIASEVGEPSQSVPPARLAPRSFDHPRRWLWAALASVLVLAVAAGLLWLRRPEPDKVDGQLVAAAGRGQAATVMGLVDRGADLRRIGAAALEAAANSRYWGERSNTSESGQLETLRALLARGVNPNSRYSEGLTALMLVVRGESESPAAVKALIERGADIHAKCDCSVCDPRSGSHGCNALMIAAELGHREIVAMLLDKGASVGDKTDQGRTALMLTRNGDVARALLRKGAPPDLRDDGGRTALIWATLEGSTDVAQALIDAGAGAGTGKDIADNEGLTALAWAVVDGRNDIFQMLLAKGADTSRKTVKGMTPLMLATINGRADIVRALLQRGVSRSDRNLAGKTALDLAHERLQGPVRDEIAYALKTTKAN